MKQSESPETPVIQTIRDSAKWVLGAFAAIGATLVAGLQLSDIGALPPGLRLAAALLGLAVAISAVTRVIFYAADIMVTTEFISFREVNSRIVDASAEADAKGLADWMVDDLVRQLQREKNELFGRSGATGIADLSKMQTELSAALSSIQQSGSAEWRGKRYSRETQPELEGEATYVWQTGDRIVQWANAWVTRDRFHRLRLVVVRAGTALIAGLLLYSWGVNPSEGTPAVVERPTPVTVAFSENARDHLGIGVADPRCIPEGGVVDAVAIGGPWHEPMVVIPPVEGCPAARLEIDDDLGVVLPEIDEKGE